MDHSSRTFSREPRFGSNTARGGSLKAGGFGDGSNATVPNPFNGIKGALRLGMPPGGTIINIIVAVVILGLLAFGILWLIKSFRRRRAAVRQCDGGNPIQCDDRQVSDESASHRQNIQIYASAMKGFPPSQQELMEYSGSTQLFRCPAPDGEKYVYIPRQSGGMSPLNVLVYEPKPSMPGAARPCAGRQLELSTPRSFNTSRRANIAGLR